MHFPFVLVPWRSCSKVFCRKETGTQPLYLALLSVRTMNGALIRLPHLFLCHTNTERGPLVEWHVLVQVAPTWNQILIRLFNYLDQKSNKYIKYKYGSHYAYTKSHIIFFLTSNFNPKFSWSWFFIVSYSYFIQVLVLSTTKSCLRYFS